MTNLAIKKTNTRTVSWPKFLVWELWLPASLLLAWWAFSASSKDRYWIPLSEILTVFFQDVLFGEASHHIIPSMINLVLGLGIGLVLGIILGTLIGSSQRLERATRPFLEVSRAIPPIALIPVAISVFGIGSSGKIWLIAFAALWPVLLNTVEGVRSVEPALLEMSRGYRIPQNMVWRLVKLPAAMPQIMVGIRWSVSLAIIVMVSSEMFSATEGIGFYLTMSQKTFAISETWAATILLGLIGYLANLAVRLLEYRLLAWHRGRREATQ